MHESAELVLKQLRESPELLDRWIDTPAEMIVGLSLSARRAALIIRQNGAIGYQTTIGFVASYLEFERMNAKSPWQVIEKETGETIWTADRPSPAAVMNWLQWHSESTIRDILKSCYGRPAPSIDYENLRWYAGYLYQVDYFTAHPTLLSDPTALDRWREKITELETQHPKGSSMFTDETSATETAETPKPVAAVVKKKVAAPAEKTPTASTPVSAPAKKPAVSGTVKGTGTTKATRKRVAKAPKAEKPKAEKKARASSADDPYTKKKLDVQAKLKIGESYTYHGSNKAFAEKRVKVTGHEARGGINIEMGDKKLVCSPFALLPKEKKDDPAPKAKGKKTA